jgi:fibronectin-binding autotransporter adhesin
VIHEGTLTTRNGSIPNASAVLVSSNAGARFKVETNETIGALSGGSGANGVVELANDSELTVGDIRHTTFGGDTIGSGSLRKIGAGTLTLTGSNFYGRGVTVDEGKLTVNGSVTLGGGSQAAVNADGTIGGAGVIVGDLTLNGGALAPGASAGTLTVNGSLVLNSASALAYELNAIDQTEGGGVNDLVTGVADLTLAGALIVTAATVDSFLDADLGDTWRLINYSGNLSGSLTPGMMPALADPTWGWVVDTSTTGQVNLLISIVPEASAFLFGGVACAVAGLAYGGRRLRRPA